MIGGVSFQPGVQDDRQMSGNGSRPGSNQGVQEAIRVLSLRLPKVVGAQAVAPNALLRSPGSGGNPQIDSMVDGILAKYFPQAAQGPPQAPMMPQPQGGAPPMRSMASQPQRSPVPFAPRVTVGIPPPGSLPEAPFVGGAPRFPEQRRSGTDADLSGGGQPPGLISELPAPLPDLRRQLDWLPANPTPDPFEMF